MGAWRSFRRFSTQRLLTGMYERKWGRIVGISLAEAFPSPAYAYNVAKAARTQTLLLMRDKAWKHGVTVNVIGPGPVQLVEARELAHAVLASIAHLPEAYRQPIEMFYLEGAG
ncbi:MAG: SDR family NAD(P)-dependent oxidoreductase, partial [Planctomycetota bacterium]|nr:SDR family NAD(P)-dependent oxidoreductase [Planctomycetota bacterium]